MANAKRLEILNLLAKAALPVQEMVKIMRLRKANISQHLALLRNQGLVKAVRKGQSVWYSIVNPKIVEPCRIFKRLFNS